MTGCMRSFLNDVERISSREYEPSDEDIVRARLRTLGVQEHKIKFEHGRFFLPRYRHVFDLRSQDLHKVLNGSSTMWEVLVHRYVLNSHGPLS